MNARSARDCAAAASGARIFVAGDFERSVDDSPERPGPRFVDRLLTPWPNAQIPLAESIGALCRVRRAGLAKHIGVANFNIAMIEQAHRLCSEPPAALQIEVHPCLDRTAVIAAARRHGMAAVGDCPLARGKVPGDEVLQAIGRGKTPAQNGVIPIPRTSRRERLAESPGSLEFTLTAADMAQIDKLKHAKRTHRLAAAGAAMGFVTG